MAAGLRNRIEVHPAGACEDETFDEFAQFRALNVLGAAQRMRIVADIQALNLNAFGIIAQRMQNYFDLRME